MQSTIPTVYIVIGAGLFVLLIGQKLGGRRLMDNRRPHGGGFLSFLGAAAIVIGLYAGFMGPVTIGSHTLEAFPFTPFGQKAHGEALAYARANVQLSSRSAQGWVGGSTKSLECIVKNNGSHNLSRLILRLATSSDSGPNTVDLILNGPFPKGRETPAILDIPANVSRSYFASPGITLSTVVGARF